MAMVLIRIIKGMVFLGIIAGGVAWLSGGFESRISPKDLHPRLMPSAAVMEQAPVESVFRMSYECASGVLESSRRTTISSRILARIEKILVVAGDRVSSGDTVIELESRDLGARVKQAEQLLYAAQAEKDLAQAEEARIKTLLEQGITTRQQYDQALSTLQTAVAQVERRNKELDETKIAFSYSVIKTPVSGRVVDRIADPGDTATPGTPLLRVYDPSRLRVEAPVRESLAVRLRVGDSIQVHIVALNERMSGTISEIVPFAETGTRTMLIKVAIPDSRRLVGGMFARIAVPAEKQMRLYIPIPAVEKIGQLEFVSLVNKSGHTEKRLVTTGGKDQSGRIEILSGLKADETVTWPQTKGGKPVSSLKKSSDDNFC